MAKRWKPQEITYLKRYAKVRLLSELTDRFRTSPEEVTEKLKTLQLATKDGHGYIPRCPGYGERNCQGQSRWGKRWFCVWRLWSAGIVCSGANRICGRLV